MPKDDFNLGQWEENGRTTKKSMKQRRVSPADLCDLYG